MTRRVVATPLFGARMKGFLEEYAARGAVRFVLRLQNAYQRMLENVASHEEIAPARRRSVHGKLITVREYVLDAGARQFLVLYRVPEDPAEPIELLNIRIGGQNRFVWKPASPAE